jgi:hypothetical protein
VRRFLRRKWLVRFALPGLALALSLPLGYWFVEQSKHRVELNEITRQLDESDPGWTTDELAASHNARLPPDERNSFRLVRETLAALPPDRGHRDPIPNWMKQPTNTLPRAGEQTALRRELASMQAAVASARRLVDYPDGGRVVVIAETPIETNLDEVQKIRSVVWLLKLDALAAASDNRPADAVRSIRALVNAGRAIGDEPVATSQMIRSGCVAVSHDAIARVLGLCEPDAGLAELQAELFREADFPGLYHSCRAERAFLHQTFRQIESGAVQGVEDEGWLGRIAPFPLAYRPDDHAFGLRVTTEYVSASRRPFAEQWRAFQALPELGDDELMRNPRHLYAILFAPPIRKMADASLRARAALLAHAAGIACERYRRRFGKWPESLAAIPKEILPAVPTDPFTGQPLVYRRLPDGIVVYSVGPDGRDDGGLFRQPAATSSGSAQPCDYGIRLWNPDQRRQPAPPRDEAPAAANP